MKILVLSFLAISVAALSPAADGSSISGNWKIHTSIAGNESDMDCTFSLKPELCTDGVRPAPHFDTVKLICALSSFH
jgi:hypothetical protein